MRKVRVKGEVTAARVFVKTDLDSMPCVVVLT